MNATTIKTTSDSRGDHLDMHLNTMDNETAAALWKAMAILSMGIEATIDGNVDRVAAQWPTTAEAVWDILDGAMVRAGMSDGRCRPWVNAKDEKEAHP
jgi:hypothetical protein